jgi:hypothetical protein
VAPSDYGEMNETSFSAVDVENEYIRNLKNILKDIFLAILPIIGSITQQVTWNNFRRRAPRNHI